MTLKPASSAALAISKCVWLGVATVTKSIRWSAGSFASLGEHLASRSRRPARAECRSRGPRPWPSAGSRRQGAGDQRRAIVEHGGRAVDAADERALAAADQGHAKFAIQCAVGGHVRFARWLREVGRSSTAKSCYQHHVRNAARTVRKIRQSLFLAHAARRQPLRRKIAAARSATSTGFRRLEAVRSQLATLRMQRAPMAATTDGQRTSRTESTTCKTRDSPGCRWAWPAGLVVGLNLAGIWPQVPLHAVATHGQDNFAICTGAHGRRRRGRVRARRRDRRPEGRRAQRANATLQHLVRIQRGCAICRRPTPRTRTTASSAAWPIFARSWPPANWPQSVIYVAEVTTGQVVAYGVPWVPGRAGAADAVQGHAPSARTAGSFAPPPFAIREPLHRSSTRAN